MDLNLYLAKPDKTIAKHTEELLHELDRINQLGYIPNERIYNLARTACEFHDTGKVNGEFQKRVKEEKGKIKFDSKTEVPHNVLSAFFVNPEVFESKEDYAKVLFTVLYHHDYGDPIKLIQEKSTLIESLLKTFDSVTLTRSAVKKIGVLTEEFDAEAAWVKGLLHKCDYSASAGYLVEYPNDFLKASLEELLDGWKAAQPSAAWNQMQEFCLENTEENIIGIAQTGMGKTEGGLLWMGDHKGFFILPLRTAINAIYERVRNNILKNQGIQQKVGILHSASFDYYLKNLEEESDKLLEYEQRGKVLSLPLSISTMDQLFDFVLKYPAYELKLATLAYSKIVIDEIQMYEPNLLAYLICGLKMIHSMGGKIAILTATFPPFLRVLLSPVKFIEKTFIDDLQRHNIKVIDNKLNSQDISDYYSENKNTGNSSKILVVCNTIRKAQELYQELREEYENGELHILHSRFIKKDRAKKEREILKFGKTFDENGGISKDSGIWISTSLVEASLDIDFDILFTELKELSSLFQRFGRCNRKGVKSVTEVNCFVYTEIDSNDILNGAIGFIDRDIYEISKKALNGIGGIVSEEMKMQLMEKYFTYENLKTSNYIRTYEKVANSLIALSAYKQKKSEIDLRNIQTEDIIPFPVYEKYWEEIRACEKELRQHSVSEIRQRELIDKLEQYTVSVPLYQIKKHESEICRNRAERYEGVHLSTYRILKVIECLYDEMGVQMINYDDFVRTANIID